MDVGCDFIFDFFSKLLNFSFLQNRLFQKKIFKVNSKLFEVNFE